MNRFRVTENAEKFSREMFCNYAELIPNGSVIDVVRSAKDTRISALTRQTNN